MSTEEEKKSIAEEEAIDSVEDKDQPSPSHEEDVEANVASATKENGASEGTADTATDSQEAPIENIDVRPNLKRVSTDNPEISSEESEFASPEKKIKIVDVSDAKDDDE